MKTLYLECKMGAAGDMLMAALSELVDQEEFLKKMNQAGIAGVDIKAIKSEKNGIYGTHMEVLVDGKEEDDHHHDHDHDHEHHHDHDHDHNHEHHHSHAHLEDINTTIQNLQVSDGVKENALAVYQLLAQAEGHVHNTTVNEIHFHEVGNKDAIADIVGVCLLMEMIGADQILASSVAVGNGFVKCAHGTLPVPAPATAYLLEGIQSYATDFDGELCTPTGAALLKHFVKEFGAQPEMTLEKVGYGIGKKDFPNANILRAFLGEVKEDSGVVELVCSIDDQSAEEIGFAMNILLEEGALDVYTTSVHMKKNRPGIVLTCTVKQSEKDKFISLMFKHLSTIGIREYTCKRYAMNRHIESNETRFGTIRKKVSDGYGAVKEKYEYDDLERVAKENNLSIKEVKTLLQEKE